MKPYQQEYPIDMGFDKIKELRENSQKNLDNLQAIDKEAREKGELLYRYFYVPVADGRAYYQIIKILGTKVAVRICFGICLDSYVDHVLGERSTLPLKKAKQLVESRQALEDLFSKK